MKKLFAALFILLILTSCAEKNGSAPSSNQDDGSKHVYGGVGLFPVDMAVKAKEDNICRVHKGVAQIFRHQSAGKILTAGDQLIHTHGLVEPGDELVKLSFNVVLKIQVVSDFNKSLADRLHNVGAAYACAQHFGDLRQARVERNLFFEKHQCLSSL